MTDTFDVIVVGAGMAGASVTAELSATRRVLLIERDDMPGRHATGRSAAMFFETYGNADVRALTRASRDFLERPPADFVDTPILSPRGCIFVADESRLEAMEARMEAPDAPPDLRRVDCDELRSRVPILRPDWSQAGLADDSGRDIDVAALHQGYLRQSRRSGATVVLGAGDMSFVRSGSAWTVSSRLGKWSAPVLVDAAGAWADDVAVAAGVRPIGLLPLRRTALLLPAPSGRDLRGWPAVIDLDEQFYFKPDAGKLLLSPANEDISLPCDAAPDELDVAIAVDRFERATDVRVIRIEHRWAGLRTFASDRSPVVGFDSDIEGFFWLAGQGGYGIQMAPALARTAAALLVGNPIPPDVVAQGLRLEAVSPARETLKPAS